jgi:hypothetical protein
MDGPVRVPLPSGLWRGGKRVRELLVRAVGSDDEGFLLDIGASSPPSERATALLARCVTDQDDGEAIVRALTIGDREAVLLHLRRLSFGESVDGVVRCPRAECRQRLELTLRVSDLLLSPYEDARPTYEVTLDVDESHYAVTFRLPTADDLDHIAAIALGDPAAGALELMRRCVARVVGGGGAPTSVEAMDDTARGAIADAMADRDPQAEIELELCCASCGSQFAVIFDTATFFLQELERRSTGLIHDVHALASHYHWSEREILDLPPRRRARYLELVSDAVAGARAR